MAPWKLIFGMQLAFDITKRNIDRTKLELFGGSLPNPKFKVFFIAVSIIRQNRRLIFVMQHEFNLTRRINEKTFGIMLGWS